MVERGPPVNLLQPTAGRIAPTDERLFERAGVAPPNEVREPKGCPRCNGYGYQGRTGVFEIAVLDDDFGLWLTDGKQQQEIRKHLGELGVKSITARTLEKFAAGETSLREVARLFWSSLGNTGSPLEQDND